MFVSVLRIVVKLELIWQPHGLLILTEAPVVPSPRVLSHYHTSSFPPPSLSSPDYLITFFLSYTRTLLLLLCPTLSSSFSALNTSSPLSCSHSSNQLSLVVHVIRWYVLMAEFSWGFHVCIMCSNGWNRM